jgi:penicillin-binding protein 1A
MVFSDTRKKILLKVVLGLCFLTAVVVGVSLGIALAATKNIQNLEYIGEYQPSLPSQILDRNDQLITEFFSDEKRELVSIDELPKHLIYALITREDRDFFSHNGFSLRGTLRAVWNLVTGKYFSGGSTLTQQLSGHLYADRTDISFTRKLRELWWAFQLERSLTKYEILENYLNKMYFGSGVYGIETASRFYFGHSAREITLAESVALVVQLANTVRYNPIKYPNRLKRIQYEVLQQMVAQGYATHDEAELSFEEYWNSYDYTRASTSTAFFDREDKAPYFSEYIRGQLEEMLYGSLNIYKDGFIVHTTLNLDFQAKADEFMSEGLAKINAEYRSTSDKRIVFAEDQFVPIIDLISLVFNLEDLQVAGSKEKKKARDQYQKRLNPTLDIASLIFGIDDLKFTARMGYALDKKTSERTTVEGALVTIDNAGGHIVAMVGGSRFESINQFNRAVQAEVQPGSAFKPLYYAAAVESKKITPATMLYDSPVVFWNDDGTPYTPMNFKGEWKGPVLVREALARSMNVPSLKVLDMIGFDSAIKTASGLLGIYAPQQIARVFPRKYPLGLGIIRVAPLQMARAFSIFANQGREIIPLGVRYIEDRNGKIILEPEKELRNELRKKGKDIQIITPQTAYIMTDLLQSTIEWGTLSYAKNTVGGFTMPMAGKTGTTQNWSDIWTVGYSPYYTTAVWFGFDQPGNSLGVSQSGAVSAGPVWAKLMKEIHKNLEPKKFVRPDGILEMTVTARSGLVPPPNFEGKTTKESFIAGTEPKRFDDLHDFEKDRDRESLERLRSAILPQDLDVKSVIPGTGLFIDNTILSSGGSSGGLRLDPRIMEDSTSGKGDTTSNPLLD